MPSNCESNRSHVLLTISIDWVLGKSRSLIGDDSSCAQFGIIPAAISWLYHLIEQQKNKTGARFSIRISALEIRGRNEELTDLLASSAAGKIVHAVRNFITDCSN